MINFLIKEVNVFNFKYLKIVKFFVLEVVMNKLFFILVVRFIINLLILLEI